MAEQFHLHFENFRKRPALFHITEDLWRSAEKRHRAIPDVPTFREQGFDIVVTEWYGLLAPAGTPKPIVAKLNAEMRRILALPLGERVAAIDLAPSTPDELRSFVQSEIDRWGPVIRKLYLKAQ